MGKGDVYRTGDVVKGFELGTEEPEPIAAADTFRIGLDRNTPGIVPMQLASVLGGETGIVAMRALSDHRGSFTSSTSR